MLTGGFKDTFLQKTHRLACSPSESMWCAQHSSDAAVIRLGSTTGQEAAYAALQFPINEFVCQIFVTNQHLALSGTATCTNQPLMLQ